jgi:hypothetical protein
MSGALSDEMSERAAEHLFITTLHGPRRKHSLYFQGGVLTGPLPSNGRPMFARVRLRGSVFTESLPSNGSIRHNTNSMNLTVE